MATIVDSSSVNAWTSRATIAERSLTVMSNVIYRHVSSIVDENRRPLQGFDRERAHDDVLDILERERGIRVGRDDARAGAATVDRDAGQAVEDDALVVDARQDADLAAGGRKL